MRSQVELRLPPEPSASTLARAAVAALGSGLPEGVVSDVELLTSEVVSNAVRHANLDPSQEIVLRIVSDGYVRVEVADPGPPFEAKRRRRGSGSSGWGLFLVDALATSWGVEPEGAGKKVWFELGDGLERAT
jgi:anti-sigma regulatory factor (Ser/Thr protein kinase)